MRMLMVYNGLKSELNILAKFVFIYEKEISQMKKCSDFKGYNPSAYSFFCDELQKKLKYSKTDDIDKVKLDGKYTLSFTKNSVLIVDFYRHLRNSIVHARLENIEGSYYINDVGRNGKKTSEGYVKEKLVTSFIGKLVAGYEHNN